MSDRVSTLFLGVALGISGTVVGFGGTLNFVEDLRINPLMWYGPRPSGYSEVLGSPQDLTDSPLTPTGGVWYLCMGKS